MSRRRKKNPLLMRIIVGTVVLHVIALPIAAHFGAFDKLKRQFGQARVVLLPPPKQEKEKQQAKEKKAKPRADKTHGKAVVKRGGPVKANPNRQKVVAVNTPNDTGDNQPSIEQGTQTTVGEVPAAKTDSGTSKSNVSNGSGGETNTTAVKPTTPITPTPTEPTTKTTVAEKPKHVPVYVEPDQDYSPQPVIPDDLRSETLEKNFVAMFTVGPDGKPTDVKMVQSTGNAELDDIALKTAKKWRFKPATLDGAGTESKVKLTIEFSVE